MFLKLVFLFPTQNYYGVTDEPIPFELRDVPIMVYGKYRFRLSAGVPGKRGMGCLAAEIRLLPKMS